MTGYDPAHYTWWLASRAAGVTAFVLAGLSVMVGLALGGRLSKRPGMARALKTIHEQAALSAMVAIVVHGAVLLGDTWLRPGVDGILIPFAMDYRPVWTGLGILSGYLTLLLGLSFYFRKRIGPDRWKRAHRFTLLVWVLSGIHVLGSGTDATTTWLRAILVATAAPIAVLFAVRVLGGRRRRRGAPAYEATPAVTGAGSGASV